MSYLQWEGIEPLKEVISIVLKSKQEESISTNKDVKARELTISEVAKKYAIRIRTGKKFSKIPT